MSYASLSSDAGPKTEFGTKFGTSSGTTGLRSESVSGAGSGTGLETGFGAESAPPTPTAVPTINPLTRLRDTASAAVSSVLDSATSLSLNLGSSDNEAQPATVVIETPDEYRNLLISLSGDKSDHVLWIECLKQYHWEGDRQSEFEFALDKFGIPHLKNGDYTMNLCHDCLDLVEAQQSAAAAAAGAGEDEDGEPGFSLIWEANYSDSGGADDFAPRIDAASVATVIRKCANLLLNLFDGYRDEQPALNLDRKNSLRSSKDSTKWGPVRGLSVVAYMPNVVQLFVLQMAAARVGAVLTFINASLYDKADDVAEILALSGADTVFTVDGFFIGDSLHETKRTLDDAIEQLQARPETSHLSIRSVVVVRHVGANPSIPPPVGKASEERTGRRPVYGFHIPYTDGRDRRWSELMLAAVEESECEWQPAEHPIFNTIRPINLADSESDPSSSAGPNWRLETYNVGQVALLVRLAARQLRAGAQTVPAAVGPVLPLVDGEDLLFLSMTMAVPLAGFALLMCESPPAAGSSSWRLFDILRRQDVRQLILAERHARPFMDEEADNTNDEDLGVSLEQLYTVSGTRRANGELVARLAARLPRARHLHLHC